MYFIYNTNQKIMKFIASPPGNAATNLISIHLWSWSRTVFIRLWRAPTGTWKYLLKTFNLEIGGVIFCDGTLDLIAMNSYYSNVQRRSFIASSNKEGYYNVSPD